jgi:DNA-binding XRE family transcriptional regulator
MTPKQFKDARKYLRLSQVKLAKMFGVAPRTVWGVENQDGEVQGIYAIAIEGLLLRGR